LEKAMNTSTLNIRPAVRSDLDAMVSLLQTLFAIEEDFSPDLDRQRQGLLCLLDGGKHRCVLVAENADQVIAMATAQILISTAQGGPVGLVEDVVVQKECRGRGVGCQLMNALTEWAAERGLSRLQLLAGRGNQAALDFYRKIGWQTTGLIGLRYLPSIP
jgi:ribosomal protein S18 acetylase RimI-like enzyme